ncbi:MAG: hypothetical protein IKC52_05020 [Clostridia bacterium]|nr:hypothetical protein [Clostridia bacterium]
MAHVCRFLKSHEEQDKTQCTVLMEQQAGQDTIIAHGRLFLQQHIPILHYDANVGCDDTAVGAGQKQHTYAGF